MFNFGILHNLQIHYPDSIPNCEYHYFYYHDSKIFSVAQF